VTARDLTDVRISAVLTDVDGTLVTQDKVLTERALAAVRMLRESGLVFTITSGRPPFGMRMLVEPLGIALPMAAYNGGVIFLPDQSILDERTLPDYVLPALLDMIQSHGLDVFVFRAHDWFVRSLDAPRVARESSTIQRDPIVVPRFDDVLDGVVKVVGVSMDHPRVAACEAAVQAAFGAQVSAARSQPHYLDVTHPTANKGVVIERLAHYLAIPLERFAALGDQPNDVFMFKRAGVSIAMGNASDEVKRDATFVTSSYADEGFANAIEKLVLPRAEPAGGPGTKPTAWLHRLGQSLWLDDIAIAELRDGALDRAVAELSASGFVWDPASCARALDDGAYDEAIAELARAGTRGEELAIELALGDAREAADRVQPMYERSDGVDGWVSLPLSPLVARDARTIVAAAESLIARAGRTNVMIAIPGTPAYLPAIEATIAAGIAVDVGLLFSREQYLAAAEAFLCGIERRVDAGLRPDIASVASVVVGGWDAAVAKLPPSRRRDPLGVAMAQRTYKAYRGLLHSPRWQRIYNAGARMQRLLWSHASDLPRVKALTAPFTVIAMPFAALEDVAERGEIVSLLRADGGACETTLAAFKADGIDVYALAARLQDDALAAHVRSWKRLVAAAAARGSRMASRS
jgi:transaldolase